VSAGNNRHPQGRDPFQKVFYHPFFTGEKSLSVNLSDIAAMGGTPFCYFVSLSVPENLSLNFVKELYRGMHRQAKEFNTVLLGATRSLL